VGFKSVLKIENNNLAIFSSKYFVLIDLRKRENSVLSDNYSAGKEPGAAHFPYIKSALLYISKTGPHTHGDSWRINFYVPDLYTFIMNLYFNIPLYLL